MYIVEGCFHAWINKNVDGWPDWNMFGPQHWFKKPEHHTPGDYPGTGNWNFLLCSNIDFKPNKRSVGLMK